MEQIIINANLRDKCGKGTSTALRNKANIPAVFYGKGQKNLHISVSPKDLEKAVRSEMGMNTLMTLKVDKGGEFNVLLKDYQAHPIKRNFIHADFVYVDLNQKIEISVPVHLTGKAIGIKEGGILEQITRELDVLCFPNKIIKQIDVDVTSLKIGDNLHLSDVKLPEGVEAVSKTNLTIAAIVAQKEEEVAAPAAMVEPEVLTAKKDADAPAAEGDKKDAAKKEAKPAEKK